MKIEIIGNGISAHLAALKYIENPLKWNRQDDYFTLPMSSTLDLIPFLKDSYRPFLFTVQHCKR